MEKQRKMVGDVLSILYFYSKAEAEVEWSLSCVARFQLIGVIFVETKHSTLHYWVLVLLFKLHEWGGGMGIKKIYILFNVVFVLQLQVVAAYGYTVLAASVNTDC